MEKLNLPYSEDSLEELINLIYDHLQFYKQNPLPKEMFAVFIDAYHGKIRDENGKAINVSIFVVVGIDMEGHKVTLGWWVKKGKENKGFWNEVLQDLIPRGLSKVCIFVTDDFQGLRKKIMESITVEEAEGHWERFIELLKSVNSKYARELLSKKENYIAFVSYPEEVRRFIYTTNVVKSVNAGLEFMRLELGGYFPSLKCLEVNLFIQFSNLNDRWMRKPIPKVRANLYRLRQLINVRFEVEDVVERLHNFSGKSQRCFPS